MPQPIRRLPHGFTMVELMTVLVLVSILLAVATPSFIDMIARQRVRSVNAELVGDIRYARSESVQRNREVAMEFRSNAGLTCYSIFLPTVIGNCNCLRPETTRCSFEAVELKTVQVPRSESVTLAASSSLGARVTFDKDRSLAAPPDMSIDIASARGGRLNTRINPVGQVKVCSPDGSIPGVPAICS